MAGPELTLAQALCDLEPVQLDALAFERGIAVPNPLYAEGAERVAETMLTTYSPGDALALVASYDHNCGGNEPPERQ